MAAASESNSEERLRRALLAHVRQDFSAPVGAVVGFAEILLDEAPRYGLERLVPDLELIHKAALALQRLVDGLLDPPSLADRGGAGNDEAFRSRLRHDLRTPMNAVMGYGEMLLEDVVAAEATAFVRDLEKMLAAAKRLLVRIDLLVDFAEFGAFAAADAVSAPGRSLDRLSHLIRPVPAESGPATAIDSCRILVVDDHQSSRDLLARHLARDGHDVVTAEDGEQGLKLAEGGAFDLVLLDLLMPRMSGYEVLCRLKSDSRYGGLPVIMISALDEIDSVVRCIEAGAEDYLPKPFDAVLLRARINSCLERKRLRDREKVFTEQLRREKREVGGPPPQRPAEADRGPPPARRGGHRRPRFRRNHPVCGPGRIHPAVGSSAGDAPGRTVEPAVHGFRPADGPIRHREDQDHRRRLYGRRRPARGRGRLCRRPCRRRSGYGSRDAGVRAPSELEP